MVKMKGGVIMTAQQLIAKFGGTIVMNNGVLSASFPTQAQADAYKAAVAAGTTSSAASGARVNYNSITNPPERPLNIRRKDYHDFQALSGVFSYDFFGAVGTVYPINYNFDTAGIKENMEILGIRALISPQSFQQVDSTYCTVMNLFLNGSWELQINRSQIYTGRIQTIAPDVEWRPDAAGTGYTTSLKTRPFLFFRDAPETPLDRLVVDVDDFITVKAQWAAAFTVKSDMTVGFELATRPLKKGY